MEKQKDGIRKLKVTYIIDEDLHQILKIKATVEKKNISDIVNGILEKALL